MHGRLNFISSFNKHPAMLSGVNIKVLIDIYHQKLNLLKGVYKLIKFLKSMDIKIAIVSSGFSYFVKYLVRDLELDYFCANKLNIVNNKLTSTLSGSIIDAEVKACFVSDLFVQLSIAMDKVIVLGAGANDLKMLKIAGLSVGLRSKPIIADNVDVIINHSLAKIINFFS